MIAEFKMMESESTEVAIGYGKDSVSFDPLQPLSGDGLGPVVHMYWNAFRNRMPAGHRLSVTFDSPFSDTGGLGSSAAISVLTVAGARRINNELMDRDSLFAEANEMEKFFHEIGRAHV
jgi:mevalonate kinase